MGGFIIKRFAVTIFVGILALSALIEPGFSQSPFYEGKTVIIVLGTAAGGLGDLRTKAFVALLRKHIPGNPTIVIEYMPGGGGRKAANHLYKTARPDGLTIGAMLAAFVPTAFLDVGVLYDLDKVIYLGAIQSGVSHAFFTRKGAGLDSLEKLRAASGIRIGAPSVGHITYSGGRIFAQVLGLKDPRFVTGYGGPELDVATLRGEIDGRAQSADAVVEPNDNWVEKGLIDLHTIIEVPKGKKHPHPQLARLPDLETLAKSDRERKLITLYRAFRMAGPPLILPPGTPKQQVEILRAAVRKTFEDPEYPKEQKKLTGENSIPLTPEAFEKVVRDLPRDPATIDLFKQLSGAGPLPPP
jgi:tripartite-type tricarboxylate transporter receptor subunit TctC